MGVTMTESAHDRLQHSELFDGPVDAEAVSRWPAWAREHLRACPSCQACLDAERSLHVAAWLSADSERRFLRDGPPPRAELEARLVGRQAPVIEDLIAKVDPLPVQVMRFEGSPVELRRTSGGVRVWHPGAKELLVLAAEPNSQGVILRHYRDTTPGVGLDLDYQPEGGAQVVALASNQPLEPEHWLMWLRDAVESGEVRELVQQCHSSFIHVAEATIPPPLRSSLLRVQDEPLPAARPDVTALLKKAANAGRADDAVAAAQQYREALGLAVTHGDRTGQIKAGIGVSIALMGLGYPDDGDKALRWVIDNHTLDADWAAWVCQRMATEAMYRVDLDGAWKWADESDAHSGEPRAWGEKVKASVLFHQREWRRLSQVLSGLSDMDLPRLQRAHADSLSAVALANQGHAQEAFHAFERMELPPEAPLEGHLHWASVQAELEGALGEKVDWSVLVNSVAARLQERDGGLLSAWDFLPLLRLVELARDSGNDDAATRLLKMRFFDSERAASTDHRLLGLCHAPGGLLLLEPAGAARVTRLPVSEHRLRSLLDQADRELRAGNDLHAVDQLGALLLDRFEWGRGPIWVGSDGLLTGAPMNAIGAAAAGFGADIPAFRELVGHRGSPPPRPSAHLDIVSIADAQANLPWASREVSRSEASLWVRGDGAVRQHLSLDAPCGLLHIGVHVRRELGAPQLMFADGPMGPLELAQLNLPGAPVVLLAGCFTAAAQTEKGVERSLADSFLRAGASAVIATRWAVEDREMHEFVRAIVEAWPFADAAEQVAETCRELRSRGMPARCWAAPVVY